MPCYEYDYTECRNTLACPPPIQHRHLSELVCCGDHIRRIIPAVKGLPQPCLGKGSYVSIATELSLIALLSFSPLLCPDRHRPGMRTDTYKSPSPSRSLEMEIQLLHHSKRSINDKHARNSDPAPSLWLARPRQFGWRLSLTIGRSVRDTNLDPQRKR